MAALKIQTSGKPFYRAVTPQILNSFSTSTKDDFFEGGKYNISKDQIRELEKN